MLLVQLALADGSPHVDNQAESSWLASPPASTSKRNEKSKVMVSTMERRPQRYGRLVSATTVQRGGFFSHDGGSKDIVAGSEITVNSDGYGGRR